LVLVALVAVLAHVAVEALPVRREQPYYEAKVRAAQLARDAMETIKAERLRVGIPLEPEVDPLGTGLIGSALSPVTSNSGALPAKRASTNPNFAAILVEWLGRAGIQRGDLVAVGVSGSFPALNVAAFAALQTLEAEAVVVASASSSQFGANDPRLLWIDMERVLREGHVLRYRSAAASRGGIDDRGFGIPKEGRALLDEAIVRNGLVKLEARSLVEMIDKRMRVYDERARGRPFKAYVNVGGGSASVGTHVGKKLFKPGLNLTPPSGPERVDSVMMRFAERGVPVIHVTQIIQLARRYGLETDPAQPPGVGEGEVFVKAEYDRRLAAVGVALVLAMMLAFLRLDVGLRILRGVKPRSREERAPEQMV
jgi:poly-gamma-glutamate system protein